MTRPLRDIAGFTLALCVSLLIAYAPAIRGEYVWTDEANLVRNPTLKGLDGLARIWLSPANEQYFPLTFTTFWIEKQLIADTPTVARLINLALHALTAALLWRLLADLSVPGAPAAALLFALHPVQVESVAWISERRSPLSACFALLAARAYLASLPVRAPSADSRAADPHRLSRSGLFATAGWFLLALLSKSVTVTLPGVLLLLHLLRGDSARRIPWRRLALLGAMSAAAGLIAITHEHAVNGRWLDANPLSAGQRAALAGRSAWFLLSKLFWPTGLALVYDRDVPEPPIGLVELLPLAAVLALGAALFGLRRHIGAGPFVALACFGVTLLPVSGVVPFFYMKYSVVADRFAYLPSMSLAALAAAGGAIALRRVPRGVSLAAFAATAAGLTALTFERAGRFSNSESLWRDCVSKSPKSWIAHAMYARAISDDHRWDEALEHYAIALQLRPCEAMAHNNVGVIYREIRQLSQAERSLRRAIECDPAYADAALNLAGLLMQQRRTSEAIDALTAAWERSPRHPGLTQALAGALREAGRRGEADQVLQRSRRP